MQSSTPHLFFGWFLAPVCAVFFLHYVLSDIIFLKRERCAESGSLDDDMAA